jgi:hypothetical protein
MAMTYHLCGADLEADEIGIISLSRWVMDESPRGDHARFVTTNKLEL